MVVAQIVAEAMGIFEEIHKRHFPSLEYEVQSEIDGVHFSIFNKDFRRITSLTLSSILI